MDAGALRGPVRWIRPAGHVLTAAATVFLCLSLWSLIQAGRGADHDLASTRDEVSRTAVRHLALLNSVDPKVAELDLTHWLDVATGPFHDALKRDMPAARARAAKQKAASRGRVTALAVTRLDRGEATVIASVRILTAPAGNAGSTGDSGDAAEGTELRRRYEAELRRVGGTWKISALRPLAPAGGSAP